jgi:hypothetical protein
MTWTVETAFRHFQHASIEGSALPVIGAVVLHLSDPLLSEGGIVVETWSGRKLGGTRFRFEMRWRRRGGDGESEPPHAGEMRSIAFDYHAERDRLAPRSRSARTILERAGRDDVPPLLDVLPEHYHPGADRREDLWSGRAARACQSPTFVDNCLAMESFFRRRVLVEALRWMVTLTLDEVHHDAYRAFKTSGECDWNITSPIPPHFESPDWGTHRITYECPSLDIDWSFGRDRERISGVGPEARIVTAIGQLEATPGTASGSWHPLRQAFTPPPPSDDDEAGTRGDEASD